VMRFMSRCAIIIGLSVGVFLLMQLLFDGSHCLDCGARYGFPLSYMQDGTYATRGCILWIGFLGDLVIAVSVSALTVWFWLAGRSQSNPPPDFVAATEAESVLLVRPPIMSESETGGTRSIDVRGGIVEASLNHVPTNSCVFLPLRGALLSAWSTDARRQARGVGRSAFAQFHYR
jgi:hypothetical protein